MEKMTTNRNYASSDSVYRDYSDISRGDIKALEEALWAHDLSQLVHVSKLESGLVNQTWLCQTKREPVIIQKKTKAFDTLLYTSLYEHLGNHDVAIPRLFTKVHGRRCSESFFVFSFEENHAPDVSDPMTYLSAGCLLAKTHVALNSFSYSFESSIPHFHDAHHYAQKLQNLFCHNNCDARVLADVEYLRAWLHDSSDFIGAHHQVIHGDPKLANILFTKNNARMLIDWEACMKGSVYFDIGDSLRSWCKTSQNTYDVSVERLMLLGYSSVENAMPLERALVRKAVSGQIVELATRYLIDSRVGTYFSYSDGVDAKKENLARAKKGMEYHKAFRMATNYGKNGDDRCVE